MFRRLLEMHGIDPAGVASVAGVALPHSTAPTERIEVEAIDRLLAAAIPLVADPAFGLLAARCWHPANLGVLGHAWLSSSTLRTGLARLARYSAIVGQRAVVELEDVRRGLKVRFWALRGNPADVPVAAFMVDVAMAVILDMCRMNAGAALRPLAASLRRRRPASAEPYERFFGCEVAFGAEENAFILPRDEADHPLPSSNRQLAAVFDAMLTEQLGRLEKSDIVARCKAAVLGHFASGELSAEEAAKELHMSPRTLQRKLADARTTYQRLVDDTRRDLALRYIEDPARSVTDITFSLGFSQPSAFTRAFRRWTGATPSDYRARRAGAAAG
jgi:AraC-like DNA-binding protein